ncbi:MAG: MarC family protein [Burkholderiaceae bacterium]
MTTVLGSFLFAFASFFPVVNPLGGAMLFLSMTPDIDRATRADLARRIAIYSFITLAFTLLAGAFVLSFFGISIGVLRVAGGLVLLSAGWHALNDQRSAAPDATSTTPRDLQRMAFFPFTLPLTVGPGTIAVATAIGTSSAHTVAEIVGTALAAVAIVLLVWVCFRYCDRINRAVGETGSEALARVFAFILICVGVQVLWTGVVDLIGSLPAAVA